VALAGTARDDLDVGVGVMAVGRRRYVETADRPTQQIRSGTQEKDQHDGDCRQAERGLDAARTSRCHGCCVEKFRTDDGASARSLRVLG
jgi:hypothetical protein